MTSFKRRSRGKRRSFRLKQEQFSFFTDLFLFLFFFPLNFTISVLVSLSDTHCDIFKNTWNFVKFLILKDQIFFTVFYFTTFTTIIYFIFFLFFFKAFPLWRGSFFTWRFLVFEGTFLINWWFFRHSCQKESLLCCRVKNSWSLQLRHWRSPTKKSSSR